MRFGVTNTLLSLSLVFVGEDDVDEEKSRLKVFRSMFKFTMI